MQIRHGAVAESLCGRQLKQTGGVGAPATAIRHVIAAGLQAQELHRRHTRATSCSKRARHRWSDKCISHARLSQAWAARQCQPLDGQWSGSGCAASRPGAPRPESQRCCRARTAAAAEGKTHSPRSALRRSAAAGAMTWRVSPQDAQCAAWRSELGTLAELAGPET